MSLLCISYQECSPRMCQSFLLARHPSLARKKVISSTSISNISTVTPANTRYNLYFRNHCREPLKRTFNNYKIQKFVKKRFTSHRCVVASLEPSLQYSRNFNEQLILKHETATLAISPIRKSFKQRILLRIQKLLQKIYDAIYIFCRSFEIAVRVTPIILASPASQLSSHFSDIMWRYTLYSIQKLGPAFVKISQWAATRRDIFPPYVCDRLATLHDANLLHSWKYTFETLQEALGDTYHLSMHTIETQEDQGSSSAIYSKPTLILDPNQVIGSGSIAQVYKATLVTKSSKQDVAIKVLHPNISHKIERDLNLMKCIAEFVHSLPVPFLKMMNLPHVQQNFAHVMRAQMDLQIESQHLETFRKHFETSGKIAFPEPIHACQGVLVEEYVDSLPISAYMPHNESDESDELHKIRRKEIAAPLLRSFLKMVFMDNYIHSDLHHGNIKVRKTRKTQTGGMKEQYTIVFLDCGIVTQLSENDRKNLRDLIKAVILNNGQEAGRLMVERAKYETCSQVEGGIEQFSKGVGEIVSDFHDRRREGLTLGAVRIGALLARVLDLCRLHGVEIDPAMSNVVVSTLILEGLGRSLDPDTNLFDVALPFVLGHGKV